MALVRNRAGCILSIEMVNSRKLHILFAALFGLGGVLGGSLVVDSVCAMPMDMSAMAQSCDLEGDCCCPSEKSSQAMDCGISSGVSLAPLVAVSSQNQAESKESLDTSFSSNSYLVIEESGLRLDTQQRAGPLGLAGLLNTPLLI